MNKEGLRPLVEIIREYAGYHLEVGKLKSEEFLVGII